MAATKHRDNSLKGYWNPKEAAKIKPVKHYTKEEIDKLNMVKDNTWDGKGEMPEKCLEHPDYFPPKKKRKMTKIKTPYDLAVEQVGKKASDDHWIKYKGESSVNWVETESFELKAEDLAEYDKVDAERKVRPASDFTDGVLDYFMHGDKIAGRKLPFNILDNKFRLGMKRSAY